MHRELAATFAHSGVARAYQHRPPYPDEVFDVLVRLITDRPPTVLDLGAGEGALARPLADRVDHVDAVDISAAMVDAGRHRPGGQSSNLRWIVGPAESVELGGPYALVTAGASLHWMDRTAVLGRVRPTMTQHAVLAVVEHRYHEPPWRGRLNGVIAEHSRNQSYDPDFSLVDALGRDGIFDVVNRVVTEPTMFRQSVADYVEQFHSTASLARELMPVAESAAFDDKVAEIVRPFAVDGLLELQVVAEITWGTLG